MDHFSTSIPRQEGGSIVVRPDIPRQAPFSALPNTIADDPTIPATDKAVLLVLAGHAWGNKALAWPSNETISKKVGKSVGQVKKRLAALEARGLILREASAENFTGRVIRLLWRTSKGGSSTTPPGGSSARPEARRIPEPENTSTLAPLPEPKPIAEKPPGVPATSLTDVHSVSVGAPPEDAPTACHADQIVLWTEQATRRDGLGIIARMALKMIREPSPVIPPTPVATPPPALQPTPRHIETLNRIKRLRLGCPPEEIEAIARQVATQLDDLASLGKFRKDCREVVSGALPLRIVATAYKLARFSDTARNNGSVYVAYVRDHRPRPN